MLVREAIVACTDPAAEGMMCVLEFCERRDAYGKVHSLGNRGARAPRSR